MGALGSHHLRCQIGPGAKHGGPMAHSPIPIPPYLWRYGWDQELVQQHVQELSQELSLHYDLKYTPSSAESGRQTPTSYPNKICPQTEGQRDIKHHS